MATNLSTLQGANRLAKSWGAKITISEASRFATLPPSVAREASVNANAVHLVFRLEPAETIPFGDLEKVNVDPETVNAAGGMRWYRVRLHHVGGDSSVAVLSKRDADVLVGKIEAARHDWWHQALTARSDALNAVRDRLDALGCPPRYVDIDAFRDLTQAVLTAVSGFAGRWPKVLSDAPEVRVLRYIRTFFLASHSVRARANEAFVANELVRSCELFDRIGVHPLTPEQRKAVVVDERRNLIIAAAGSGKTSVIVAKAAWLVQRGFQRPSQLLLLAFANAARDEMKERLRTGLDTAEADDMTVRTFHGLAVAIIGEADGRRPSLAAVAEDDLALLDQLKGFVEALRDDPKTSAIVLDWFRHLFAPYRSQHDFKTLGEYYDYLRSFSIRALNGEKVKSFEEVVVANFLYLNGIRYEYEAPYEHDTATSTKRQYKPDFYLSDFGIYIEHFGLDANGKTAPYVNRKKYLWEMEWKRGVHARYGTVLIETFSHQHADGVLLRNLEDELAARGVIVSPIPPERVFAVLREKGRIAPFTKLVATFLRHFKSAGLSFPALAKRAAAHRDRARSQAFLGLFRPIFDRYQQALDESGEVDFEDMISQATDLVEAGRFHSPFRYILVDEFQDISPGRARLLKSLLQGSPGARLFAVGDDWQAIYRFTGSDTAIMREFGERFGPFERSDLETTFRCSDRLAAVATDFVLRNRAQIRKAVRATRSTNRPAVHVGLPGEQGRPLLLEALDRIAEDARRYDGTSDVLLISRYRHQKPGDMDTLKGEHPGLLRLDWTTAHGSKGRQADYVVVLSLCSGNYGFPSEMVDDPLLDLVLAAPEDHPNAEERRLLYVAITRARRQAFLLADGDPPSSFVNELIGGKYDIAVFGRPTEGDVSCPRCSAGRLIERKNTQEGSSFYGCSNYPWCEHKVDPCSKCSTGLPVRVGDAHRCRQCDALYDSCPDCDGWLGTKEGKYGPFQGCSTWPDCDYTRSLPPS